MTISRIESVVYGVEDVAAGIRYFEDWGLQCLERGDRGADFATPAGQAVLVRSSGDAALPAAPEGGSTVREVVWGVDGGDTLEQIGAELSRDRDVKPGADGALHARDESGFAIGFRGVAPARQASSAVADATRMNKPFDPERRARPARIGHIVFAVRKKDFEKASAFYLERLKFRLSDRVPGLGDFMRCPGTNDHHTLFFHTRADRAAFDHLAFEVHGIDEIILGGKFMKGRGWVADTPVGRHILGSNLFWYFRNPCGGRTEYFADMDLMDDDWKPRVWDQHPGFAMWMLEKADAPEFALG
ncbi:MAG TPA: VOC family protein [Burkholderiales bacterium]|nr:VOC family protein [Burkholderiales bacterium]